MYVCSLQNIVPVVVDWKLHKQRVNQRVQYYEKKRLTTSCNGRESSRIEKENGENHVNKRELILLKIKNKKWTNRASTAKNRDHSSNDITTSKHKILKKCFKTSVKKLNHGQKLTFPKGQ
ncbi:hypothetical protein XENORESO_011310 [Xenotaenia resolanae]|uniref:Uncharacterized protein n=1 Tax=Xenotaenia resolanae TaxID=208358 RepID=A0ABV0WWH1_9TELE